MDKLKLMKMKLEQDLIGMLKELDGMNWLLLGLVLFIALVTGVFALRYLKGDRRRGIFLVQMSALAVSLSLMVVAKNLMVLFGALGVSNILLVSLMVHERGWGASRASGRLAALTLGGGLLAVGLAFWLIYQSTGTLAVGEINQTGLSGTTQLAVSGLLLVGAMAQSGLWPMHRWVLSSLNSPTPVSAFMHAGLINGGGILLVRFAPIYASESMIMTLVFLTGLVSTVLGTVWMLMQSDVKRTLACSTMGQMGFMVMQCGLGLFPAAVAHLCWHGLFKANQFLSTGGLWKERKVVQGGVISPLKLAAAIVCGVVAAWGFALASRKSLIPQDTDFVLVFICMLAGAQFALPILRGPSFMQILWAMPVTWVMGIVYGCSVYIVEMILAPLGLHNAYALNIFHVGGMAVMFGGWVALLYLPQLSGTRVFGGATQKLYVRLLNAGQPHPATVTSCRNHYRFS